MAKMFEPESGVFAENIRSTKGDDSQLRESMKRLGWIKKFPAIKDENGVTIAGHRRLAIAEELGIKPVIETVDFGSGPNGDIMRMQLAFASNNGAQGMSVSDRKRIVKELYERQEWTQREIAERIGVSQQTISADLGNLPAAGKLTHAKTSANPKGAGRPKGSGSKRSTPILDRAREIVRPLVEEGKPTPSRKLQEEHGISHVHIETAVAVERAVKAAKADPEIGREDLSMSAREKFDAAIRQHKKKLDAEFQKTVEQRVIEWGQNLKFPDYEKYLADAKRVLESRTRGVMSGATYRLIERCLHPDNSASDKQRNEAFIAFRNVRASVTSHAEMPITVPATPTWQDMMAKREEVRAKNSARSKAAHAKRAANGVQSRH